MKIRLPRALRVIVCDPYRLRISRRMIAYYRSGQKPGARKTS